MPPKKDLQTIRASDSPKKWAAWFFLFYPFAAPVYAITRKNWSVLINTLAFSFGISIIWEIAKFIIKSIWSYDIDSNLTLDIIFTLILWTGSAVVGFYSVKHVVASSLLGSRLTRLEETSGLDKLSIKNNLKTNRRRKSVKELLPKISPLTRQSKVFLFVTMGIIIALVGAYAIYTTAVESTIKSNPVLAAASKTGTVVNIKHFNCGETYGFYDSGIDTLEICTAVHDDQLISSKEATIRHEAWHLVQACSSVKTKDDPWGNLVLVNSPLLNGKTLTSEEEKYITDNYDKESHDIESEALLAETYLTDGEIINAMEEKCYFPD